MKPWLLALSVAALLLTHPCLADQLTMKDGRVHTGRIVAEDDDAVMLEVEWAGGSMRQRYVRSQIASITRDPQDGPSYAVIPIFGSIGSDVTADVMRQAIQAARANQAQYVVLALRSEGGSIDEMDRIVSLLRASRDLQFIAYVDQAISAAAIIAMACPRIYMTPRGTIGAAVPYKVGPEGTPQNVEEKFLSAIRARMRAAADLGGHSRYFVDAMLDVELELAVTVENGRPAVVLAQQAPDAPLIKTKGQILTLTAREAEAAGLSAGTVASIDDLRTPLGVETWHRKNDRPWNLMTARAQASKREQDRTERKRANLQYLTSMEPHIIRAREKLDAAVAAETAAAEAIRQLDQQTKQELDQMEAEYQRAPGSRSAARYNEQLAKLKERYQARLLELEARRKEATVQRIQAAEQLQQIKKNIPHPQDMPAPES